MIIDNALVKEIYPIKTVLKKDGTPFKIMNVLLEVATGSEPDMLVVAVLNDNIKKFGLSKEVAINAIVKARVIASKDDKVFNSLTLVYARIISAPMY